MFLLKNILAKNQNQRIMPVPKLLPTMDGSLLKAHSRKHYVKLLLAEKAKSEAWKLQHLIFLNDLSKLQ